MKKFTTVTSIVAYLPIANIDTDMIIPKQYLKTIKRTGLGKFLFADLRYDEAGRPIADFILNKAPFDRAEILVSEENFGCGSSREHAPWSILDFGIKVIIAPSFADIFYNNSFKNGLLPIVVSKEQISALASIKDPVTVDLIAQTITADNLLIHFNIEPHQRKALLEGMDEISETLKFSHAIDAFEKQDQELRPWLKIN